MKSTIAGGDAPARRARGRAYADRAPPRGKLERCFCFDSALVADPIIDPI